MKRSILAYVLLVVAAAATVAVLIVPRYPMPVEGFKAWSGIAALMALTVVAEGLGVRISAGRAVFSVSLIPTVATVPLFGAAVAVISTAASQAVAQFLVLKHHPVKAIFNVAQLSLAIGCGAVVYVALLA
jgi:hypothetical protein